MTSHKEGERVSLFETQVRKALGIGHLAFRWCVKRERDQ